MPFKLREGAETEGLPTITLAGHAYFVPRLALRHRIAVALLLPKVLASLRELPKPEEIKDRILDGTLSLELSVESYGAMADVVSHGLIALYPEATREALLDQPIEFEELAAAWQVVVEQGKSRRHAAGEALATNSSPRDSGESSSPTSV